MDRPQVSKQETEEILSVVQQVLADGINGDVVEFGCYKGDTSILLAKLLKTINSTKTLWLYDSFAGLPAKTPEDTSVAGEQFKAGELLVTKREVIEKFRRANLRIPIIKKAFFSDLDSEKDVPESIAFAFCDGDLYSSIKTSLKLVLPRLDKKGIIIVHDYNNPELPGVSKAVEEFLKSNQSFRLSQKYSLAIIKRS